MSTMELCYVSLELHDNDSNHQPHINVLPVNKRYNYASYYQNRYTYVEALREEK